MIEWKHDLLVRNQFCASGVPRYAHMRTNEMLVGTMPNSQLGPAHLMRYFISNCSHWH